MTEAPNPPPARSLREQVSVGHIVATLPEFPSAETPSRSFASIYQKWPRFYTPPTFEQFHGARLASRVLWFICGLAVIFLGAWWYTRPSLADVQQFLGAAANGKDVLDALQSLRTQHFNEFRDLFQLVVLSGLLPLFTLLAGYAFGARQAEKQEHE